MKFSLKTIAALLGGDIEGNPEAEVNNIAKIQEAGVGDISFLANPKYERYLYATRATAVIVNRGFAPKQGVSTNLIRVENAYSAFSSLLDEYERLTNLQKIGIEQPCFVHESASIGENAYIGAFAYIAQGVKVGANCKIYPQVYIGENTQIGDNTVLHPGVRVYKGCEIGHHCTLHAGAVIGSDGFGYAPQPDGSYKSIPQIGNVSLGNHVDIGANTTIDRATTGSTKIEDGVKIDNLVMVAHNVQIGKNTGIAAQAGISGSTSVGEQGIIAGQVGIAGHLDIAPQVTIAAKAGILGSIKKSDITVMGAPAFDLKEYLRSYAVFKKLPTYRKKIEELERLVLSMQRKEGG